VQIAVLEPTLALGTRSLRRDPPATDDGGHDLVVATDEPKALRVQRLGAEAAERREREEPVLADVRDDDSDLVDMARERERRRTRPSRSYAGERGPERVARHLCERRSGLAPDSCGGFLVSRRPGGRQQFGEEIGDGHGRLFCLRWR
jgi:hypothetical protein